MSPSESASVHDPEKSEQISAAAELLERMRFFGNLQETVASAAYVQECGPERQAIKQAIFKQLDALCAPGFILASSTSELLPSSFLQVPSNPQRCLVAHPVNPPHLIPLVELCPSPATAPDTILKVESLLSACGMTPISLEREISGFILNRLQAAVLGNASGGYAEYIELLGSARERMIKSMRSDYSPDEELFETIIHQLPRQFSVQNIPDAQNWRDRRLTSLAQHLLEQADFGSGA